MSKKHFIALADAIRAFEQHHEPRFTTHQIEMLAAFCAKQNPRFNRERWIAYVNGECGPNGGAVKGGR